MRSPGRRGPASAGAATARTPRVRGVLATTLLALALGAAACGPSARHPAPGVPSPVPLADTLPIREPAARDGGSALRDQLDEAIPDEIGWQLSVERRVSGVPAARNVTAFDDVVPSAWFEHRISGAGGLTPEEVAEGPPGPDPVPPFTVVDLKVEGVTPGFTARDAAGALWLLKVDPPGMPGLTTGADVVTSRVFWAAGWHVPRDVGVRVDPGALEPGADATVEDAAGTRPLRRADVAAALDGVERGPDGRVRLLASLFLEGTPKGPFRFEGRRPDDPNDHYPHEDRRELRGMWVVAAWTNHVDLRWRNTLDMWRDPPGYLRHHLIDFGTSLGSGGVRALDARAGQEYALDLPASLARLVTLGLWDAGWQEADDAPLHPSVGWLAGEGFDPGAWKPFYPAEPFRRLTPRDGYWGAKLVAAFTPAHVEALVAEADYPEAAAAALRRVLLERRRRVVAHWYAKVTPAEEVEVRLEGERLVVAFRDLGLEEGVWRSGATRYRWRLGGSGGVAPAAPGARQRLELELGAESRRALEAGADGPPVRLELRAEREGDASARAVHLRLRGDGAGGVRVVGVLY